jgi:outer membrane biogenesis lipoprotein LolB
LQIRVDLKKLRGLNLYTKKKNNKQQKHCRLQLCAPVSNSERTLRGREENITLKSQHNKNYTA